MSTVSEPIFREEAVRALLAWYAQSKRDLPWRRTRDPYRIWISEIMLQQTRVEAVKPYYERFLSACPTVKALAELPEEQLLKLWEGLGYYSRARNLQKAARTVLAEHNGVMPSDYEGLLSLPGIGEYTAGAIASIAYDVRVPAVDGNVLRVLSRFLALRKDVTRPEVKAELRASLCQVVPSEAGDFTQSLIELGATVCLPKGAPRCEGCPLRGDCRGAALGIAEALPVKGAKKPRRIEERTVLLLRDGDRTVLRRRPPKGLLAGLFELPHVLGHIEKEEIPALVRALGLNLEGARALELFTEVFDSESRNGVEILLRLRHARNGNDSESLAKERISGVKLLGGHFLGGLNADNALRLNYIESSDVSESEFQLADEKCLEG